MVNQFWILMQQEMMEMALVHTGTVILAKLQSDTNTHFTGRMPVPAAQPTVTKQ